MATRKTTAGRRKAPGTRAPASKPAAPAIAAPMAAPEVAKGNVLLVTTAKGSRTFHDARGLRHTVVFGETFEVDAFTAKILLKTDPEAFAKAADAPELEAAPVATGPISVADLGAGGVIAKPAEAPATAGSGTGSTPSADAATSASSGGGDEGGSAPADGPDASTSGEASTRPSSEAAPMDTGPGAEVLS